MSLRNSLSFQDQEGPLVTDVKSREAMLSSILFRTQRRLSFSFQSQWCHIHQHRVSVASNELGRGRNTHPVPAVLSIVRFPAAKAVQAAFSRNSTQNETSRVIPQCSSTLSTFCIDCSCSGLYFSMPRVTNPLPFQVYLLNTFITFLLALECSMNN